MAFDGTEGAPISVSTAGQSTAEFRREYPSQIKARFFGRDIIEDLLAQSGSKGIRIYFGLNEEKKLELFLVSADEDEKDQLGSSNIVANFSVPCPQICGNNNELNS